MSVAAQLAPRVRAAAAAQHALAVRFVEADLDRRTPRRSGALARSKRVRTSVGSTLISTRIEYLAPQAAFTDRGTRRHIIRARPGRVLAFRPGQPGASPVGMRTLRGRPRARGGPVVFARFVRHPGTKGTRWFRGALTQTLWRGYLRSAGRTLAS